MKKVAYLLIIYCFMVIAATGCNQKSESEFINVDYKIVPKAVQNFVDRNIVKNGIYLYSENGKNQYLFLNSFNVKQNRKAVFFKDISYSIKENKLNIYFREGQTGDYSNKINNKVIYKIISSDKYDSIDIFNDGKEIPIDVVGN